MPARGVMLSAYDAAPEWLAARQRVDGLRAEDRAAWQELQVEVVRLRTVAR